MRSRSSSWGPRAMLLPAPRAMGRGERASAFEARGRGDGVFQLLGAQVVEPLRDGPLEAERVDHLSVEIAPERLLDGLLHRGAGVDGLLERGVRVLDVHLDRRRAPAER